MENIVTSNVPSRQEMYDRAYRGLAGQNWQKATINGYCVYQKKFDGKILRCAWGHVDPEGTEDCSCLEKNILDLNRAKIGLAGQLSQSDLEWAFDLQDMHDGADVLGPGPYGDDCPISMKERFHWFAAKHSLVIPHLT